MMVAHDMPIVVATPRNSYTIAAGVTVQMVHMLASQDGEHHITLQLHEKSQCFYRLIITGNQKISLTITLLLKGAHASAECIGLYNLNGAAQVLVTTQQIHEVQNTSSSFSFHGIMYDQAQLNYSGLIHIDAQAQQSTALQSNKTLLFSDHARVHSVPSLQVLANKVHCAHGSAVGRLDKEMVQFLCGRGLSLHAAQELLMYGFFAQSFPDITDRDSLALIDTVLKPRALEPL